MIPSHLAKPSRRLPLLACLALAGLLVLVAPAPPAAADARTCVNGEPTASVFDDGGDYDTLVHGGFGPEVGGSAVLVDLDLVEDCTNPCSRFVRSEAVLWDGTGPVTAYLQVYSGGQVTDVPGSHATVNDSGFRNRGHSNAYDAAGQTVRACGNFQFNGASGFHCSDWYAAPAPTAEESAAGIKGTNHGDTLQGTEGADVIAGFYGYDALFGLGGNDLLLGGPGGDYLYGGAGADTLDPGPDGALMVTVGDGPGDHVRNGPGYDVAYVDTGDVVDPGVEEVHVDQTPPCHPSAGLALNPPGCNTPLTGELNEVTATQIDGNATDWDVDGPATVRVYSTLPGSTERAFLGDFPADDYEDFSFCDGLDDCPSTNVLVDHTLPSGTTIELYGLDTNLEGTVVAYPLLGTGTVP